MTDRDAIHPEELISAMLDGEISPADAGGVQPHLPACAECRLLVEELRKIGAAAKREAVPVLPDDLGARIHRRLAAPVGPATHRAPGFFGTARFPLVTAATLLVAALIWMTLNRSRVEPVRPAESSKVASQPADASKSAARTEPVTSPEELKAKKSEPEKIAAVPGGGAHGRIAREIGSTSGLEKNAPPPAVEERRNEEHKELDQAAPGASYYSGTGAHAPARVAPTLTSAVSPSPAPTTSVIGKQSAKDAKKRENRSLAAGETAESAAPTRSGLDLGPHAFRY